MECIILTFTQDSKYQLEFSPALFWWEFADSYNSIPWVERSKEKLVVVADNYSYLLNILILARDHYRRSRGEIVDI